MLIGYEKEKEHELTVEYMRCRASPLVPAFFSFLNELQTGFFLFRKWSFLFWSLSHIHSFTRYRALCMCCMVWHCKMYFKNWLLLIHLSFSGHCIACPKGPLKIFFPLASPWPFRSNVNTQFSARVRTVLVISHKRLSLVWRESWKKLTCFHPPIRI